MSFGKTEGVLWLQAACFRHLQVAMITLLQPIRLPDDAFNRGLGRSSYWQVRLVMSRCHPKGHYSQAKGSLFVRTLTQKSPKSCTNDFYTAVMYVRLAGGWGLKKDGISARGSVIVLLEMYSPF